MISKMKLDEGRELRRERREARIALKHERRQARELKRSAQTLPVEPPRPIVTEAESTTDSATEPGGIAAEQPPMRDVADTPPPDAGAHPLVGSVEVTGCAQAPAAGRRSAAEPSTGMSRRERDVAQFLRRRDELLSEVRSEARERIEREGEDRAIADALGALAHPEAAPWTAHRERLSEAIAGGRIPDVGAAARRGCRGAASDAARTSRKAPDPDLALAVALAYAVIARAPWATVRGARAERSGATSQLARSRRAFWR